MTEPTKRCPGPSWPWMLLAFAIVVLLAPFLVPAYVWDVLAAGAWDPGW